MNKIKLFDHLCKSNHFSQIFINLLIILSVIITQLFFYLDTTQAADINLSQQLILQRGLDFLSNPPVQVQNLPYLDDKALTALAPTITSTSVITMPQTVVEPGSSFTETLANNPPFDPMLFESDLPTPAPAAPIHPKGTKPKLPDQASSDDRGDFLPETDMSVSVVETAVNTNNIAIYSGYLGPMVVPGRMPDSTYDQHKVDYAPTIMYENGKYRMWWCGEGSANNYDDILYSEYTSQSGSWTSPATVLYRTGGQEGTSTCDPSVIKVGSTYYMYYGSDQHDAIIDPNKIGKNGQIFLATSSNGTNWTKYGGSQPSPIISFSPSECSGGNCYGIGQPSAIYINNHYYLYYTKAIDSTRRRTYRADSTDGIHFSNYTEVSLDYSANRGLYGRWDVDVKYVPSLGIYFMVYGDLYQPYQPPNYIPNYIYWTVSTDGITFLNHNENRKLHIEKTIYSNDPGDDDLICASNAGILGSPSGTIGTELTAYYAMCHGTATYPPNFDLDSTSIKIYNLSTTAPLLNGTGNPAVSSSLPGWPATNLTDGNTGTIWSSQFHSNPNGYEWFAFWFSGASIVNYIKITPRIGATGKPLALPETINLYYSDNQGWIFLGTFDLPNDPAGVIIGFPTVRAYGLHVTTNKLRADDYGGYYFQVAEVKAGSFDNFITTPVSRAGGVAVSSSTAGWPGSNLIDGNVNTSWSSSQHSSADNYEWFAFWSTTSTNENDFTEISSIKFIPRSYSGQAYCVPERVYIYYSYGGSWNFIKTVDLPRDIASIGTVMNFLPVKTNGVLITTYKLRKDDTNNYYFQGAEAYTR